MMSCTRSSQLTRLLTCVLSARCFARLTGESLLHHPPAVNMLQLRAGRRS
jgi:hypothetical protein